MSKTPKVSELVEIILLRMEQLTKVVQESNDFIKTQASVPSNTDNMASLKALQELDRELRLKLHKTFTDFIEFLTKKHKIQLAEIRKLKSLHNSSLKAPRWLLISVFLFIGISLTNTMFSIYQYKTQKSNELTAFENGKVEIKNHIQQFFKENPEAYSLYDNWNSKTN